MQIPDKIISAFEEIFPGVDAAGIDWQWAVPGKIYEATFLNDEELMEAEFTVTGHHLCTDRNIDMDDLPDAVLKTITERFQVFDLVHLDEVTFSDGTVLYEAGFVIGEDEEETDEADEAGEEEISGDEDEDENGAETDDELEELEDIASATYFEVLINASGEVIINDEEEQAEGDDDSAS